MHLLKNKKTQKTSVTHDRIKGLHYHREFHSSILGNKRDLIVWLPPEYEEKTRKRFPVLYVHDGQNLFDPATAFAGVDWQLDETAAELIRKKQIGPVIIVGMANTPDRIPEYTPRKGHNYARFIVEEVMPFINAHYRTKTGRENTAVMGSSLGGLISFYMLCWHPETFSMAACLSASWMWNHSAILKQLRKDLLPTQSIKIYMDHGSEGREGQNGDVFTQTRDLLIQKGLVLGMDLEYYHGAGDDHNEACWARRVWRPLVFFLGKE